MPQIQSHKWIPTFLTLEQGAYSEVRGVNFENL